MIESVQNEKIKEYAKLQQRKYRMQQKKFVVEGEHLVEEAKLYSEVECIFSLDGREGTIQVSSQVMRKLSSLESITPVLAIVSMPKNKELTGNILVLDDIQDPGNLGTIIRSAVSFGITSILASENSVDVYNSKVLRASEGMFFQINYKRGNLQKELSELKKNYSILTTNVHEGQNITSLNCRKPFALIVGNEGNGVSKEVASFADHSVKIPMTSGCESLNVAIATSILLYELAKK